MPSHTVYSMLYSKYLGLNYENSNSLTIDRVSDSSLASRTGAS